MVAIDLERTGESLAGTVGEQRVDLLLGPSRSSAGVRGECLGAKVGGYWRIESNFDNLDPVALFLGEYAGDPVHLRSEVHLTSYFAVRHADISGTVGEQELRARAAPVEAPADGPRVMGIDGHLGGAAITLFATVMGDLSSASINGIIGGHPLRIDATRTSVRGDFEGPATLFPLLVCALLYFL